MIRTYSALRSHVHIVASKLNPDTGRAYDLKGDRLTLSRWAEQYEREHGGVICTRREDANELRDAITRRDAGDVLEAITKQRSTFTARQLENALAKQIKDEQERATFTGEILGHANTVHLAETHGGPIVRYTTARHPRRPRQWQQPMRRPCLRRPRLRRR